MQQINNLREAVAAAGARPVAIQQADIDALMTEVTQYKGFS